MKRSVISLAAGLVYASLALSQAQQPLLYRLFKAKKPPI